MLVDKIILKLFYINLTPIVDKEPKKLKKSQPLIWLWFLTLTFTKN